MSSSSHFTRGARYNSPPKHSQVCSFCHSDVATAIFAAAAFSLEFKGLRRAVVCDVTFLAILLYWDFTLCKFTLSNGNERPGGSQKTPHITTSCFIAAVCLRSFASTHLTGDHGAPRIHLDLSGEYDRSRGGFQRSMWSARGSGLATLVLCLLACSPSCDGRGKTHSYYSSICTCHKICALSGVDNWTFGMCS